MKQDKIGLQLYTVREETARDFQGALRRIAEIGYQGVEFAGYGGMTAQELKSLLDELGMVSIGSHVSLARLTENLAEEIEFNATLGSQYIICPWLPEEMRDSEAFANVIPVFEQIGQEVRNNGMTFAYHNHAFEFESKIGEEFLFDALFSKTAPEAVQVELDLGWVQYAGLSTLEYVAKYKGRLPLLHLKDFRQSAAGGQIDTVEIGKGDLDIPTVIEASRAADVDWLIVEQDRCQQNPLDSVAESFRWLQAGGYA
ncbi:sugar phosphate isomerase/epimerase family protein [Paenibacillus koleovorans]|uniref:sugar phosphate isomerase/epimerase family protein n=1 Tax=Paenibacillus koleovorans TaxID=121608 RepID=UPI000FDB379B|nr:sugar phosphate isomerase/epimerase [Paenibacillus koleovorans]